VTAGLARRRPLRKTTGAMAAGMRVWDGSPYPLGVSWDGQGVNVAVFSSIATDVYLCLFESAAAGTESARLRLPSSTNQIWHGYFPDLRPGQLYGVRADGPYEPAQGLRCNVNKLLFEPYARAVGRDLGYDDSLFGYSIGNPDEDLSFDQRDSAAHAPLAAILDTAFTWTNDRPPKRELADMVIYEVHVKGYTQQHPGVQAELRGTYAGLASPAAIEHLLGLGINTVELLPVHYRISERFLVDEGLSNYWGYNTLGFFAPDPRLASAKHPAGVVREFKNMVSTLHGAGISVFLDVVYNHSAEGSQLGPTLSFRGLDNPAYYHLADNPRFTYDFTGTGNSLNLGHPRTLQLVTDSLRYWVQEMHIDGFRFDLAPELAREFRTYDRQSPFFDVVMQDPALAGVHLVAEPWDVGEGGYDVGNFPVNWSEWNGRYRDTVRKYWRGDEQMVADLATRLSGSSDLYSWDGRRPAASINLITTHDGFTLADLVSYNEKHNEANLQNNSDGNNDNDSWNCGVEGPTDDSQVVALRGRQMRNFIVTMLLSQGVPMLQGGDEIRRTQKGNNNAYCQDNELSWLDWKLDDDDQAFLDFVRRVIKLRTAEPVFRRRTFFHGRAIRGGIKDLYWLDASGQEMNDNDWDTGWAEAFGMLLEGGEIDELDAYGNEIVGDSFLLLFNAAGNGVNFQFPAQVRGRPMELVLDTADPSRGGAVGDGSYGLADRAVAVIRVPLAPADGQRGSETVPPER
jgi:isoamylase